MDTNTAAIDRLRCEPQIPLADLAGRPLTINGVTLKPTADVLLRWGTKGKAGCRLDVLFCRRRLQWVTSRAALARFAAALAERVAVAQPEPATT